MAYGKKNRVKVDPLAYDLILLGESKIGKTTLIKEICEKLGGEDCYLFLELGQEHGADCIEGINYINCPKWNMNYDEYSNSAGFADVCEDIIENKTTDYPNLRVVIWDTYDQIIKMAEREAIRLSNNYYRKRGKTDKIAESINEAWSGFQNGQKKALELMFDMKERLNSVGVKTYVIGHVKRKEQDDMASGESYQVLTNDQQAVYFSELRKMFPFLGLAYIDRNIIKEKSGKKNIVTKKEEMIGKVKEENRKIKFRDDNYVIDSGSRFAEIIPEINMNADDFIEALTNAILAEQQKSGKSVEETKAEQEKASKAETERIYKAEKANKIQKELDDTITEIITYFIDNRTNLNVIKPILAKIREMGYTTPKEIANIDDAKIILAMINE